MCSEEREEKKTFDETDRLIVQALSEELSDITVSEALIQKTLAAAKTQVMEKNGDKLQVMRKPKRMPKRVLWGGGIAVAAAVSIFVLASDFLPAGRKNACSDMAGETMESTGGSALDSIIFSDAEDAGRAEGGMNGNLALESVENAAGELQQEKGDCFSESMRGEENNAEPLDGTEESFLEMDYEWLYAELLAEFDIDSTEGKEAYEDLPGRQAEETIPETSGKLDESDTENVRSFSWKDGKRTLSGVIYKEADGYCIEVSYLEAEVTISKVLYNFRYAGELWEFAGTGVR